MSFLNSSSLTFPLNQLDLVRFSRFAKKGGIGKARALVDHESVSEEDLMFLEGDEIVILLDLGDHRYLGWSEEVIGEVSSSNIELRTKLKRPIITHRALPPPVESIRGSEDSTATSNLSRKSSVNIDEPSKYPPQLDLSSPAQSLAPSFAFSATPSENQTPRTPTTEERAYFVEAKNISPTPTPTYIPAPVPSSSLSNTTNLLSISASNSIDSSISDAILKPLDLNLPSRFRATSANETRNSPLDIARSTFSSLSDGSADNKLETGRSTLFDGRSSIENKLESGRSSGLGENTEEFIYDSYRYSRGSSSQSLATSASLPKIQTVLEEPSLEENLASGLRERMTMDSRFDGRVREDTISRTTSVADSLLDQISRNFPRSSGSSSINSFADGESTTVTQQHDLSPLLEGKEDEVEQEDQVTPTTTTQELPSVSRSNSIVTSSGSTVHQRRRASTVGSVPLRSPSIFIEHLPASTSRPGSAASSSLAMSPHSHSSHHSITAMSPHSNSSHQSIAAISRLDSPAFLSPAISSPSPEPRRSREIPGTPEIRKVLLDSPAGWTTPPIDFSTRSVWSPKSPPTNSFFKFGRLKKSKVKKELNLDLRIEENQEMSDSRRSESIYSVGGRGRSLSYGREDLIPPSAFGSSTDRFDTASFEGYASSHDELGSRTFGKSMVDLSSTEREGKKSKMRSIFRFGKSKK